MTDDEVLRLLREATTRAGGIAAWARAHDLRSQNISDMLGRRRTLSPAVAAALGLEPLPRAWEKINHQPKIGVA